MEISLLSVVILSMPFGTEFLFLGQTSCFIRFSIMWNSSRRAWVLRGSLGFRDTEGQFMSSKAKNPCRNAAHRKVSYALMSRFSELLICARCFRQNVRKPVRQLMSVHHRPLALCHDCSHEVRAEYRARVLRFKQGSDLLQFN
jgi:hypothetical protein